MTVVDLVRQYLKVKTDISDADLWVLVQQIAESLFIDVDAIDDAYGELIAGEIDKVGGGLSVTENSSLSIVEESKNGKRSKKNTPATNDSQQAQTLKPAVIGLRNAIESEVTGLSNAFDTEFTKNEKKAARKITERAKQFAPNVVNYVAEELEGYKADSQIFHGQITGIIEEAFGGFFDN